MIEKMKKNVKEWKRFCFQELKKNPGYFGQGNQQLKLKELRTVGFEIIATRTMNERMMDEFRIDELC